MAVPTTGLRADAIPAGPGGAETRAPGRDRPTALPDLPPPMQAHEHRIAFGGGEFALLEAGEGPPLLLIHSVNAAASSYEVKPIFEHARTRRRVFALDLPGFGRSTRGPAAYSIALYVQAVQEAVDAVRARSGAETIDALALSLSGEFLARAALQRPDVFRSLTLVTPTGFETGADGRRAAPGASRGSDALERTLTFPVWRRLLFKALVSRPSIRFFLRRTFGGRPDPGLVDYCRLSAQQPGAEFPVFAFASGKLFAGDIRNVYEDLDLPVWLAHGTKGSFADFSEAEWTMTRPNWAVTPFETGAFPHFQAPAQFLPLLDRFLHEAADAREEWQGALGLAPAHDPGGCL